MARQLHERADVGIRYRSLSSFYLADPRRIDSPERELGRWWKVGRHGPTHRAAWVRETGELYVERLGMPSERAEIQILGRATDEELEAALEGWADICPQPDSMTWLRHRARSLAQVEIARAPSGEPQAAAVAGPALATANGVDPNAAPLSGQLADELPALAGAAGAVCAPAPAPPLERSAI